MDYFSSETQKHHLSRITTIIPEKMLIKTPYILPHMERFFLENHSFNT